jgi:hypothetical protein
LKQGEKSANNVVFGDLGPVNFVRSKRARRISIRINPRGEVRVTVPKWASYRKAEAFLISRKDWVRRKLEEMEDRRDSFQESREGQVLNLQGKAVELRRKNESESLEDALWRTLLTEGKDYLPSRTKVLAHQHGLSITGVKIRKMTSRWGSCTARNSINLNSWLMMIPAHLVDYVILHELAHTRHKHHGKEFWDFLDRLCEGRSRQLRKELREQPIFLVNTKDHPFPL